MKIKLIQTGGILPLRKEAIQEVEWTDEELKKLLQEIEVSTDPKSSVRDGIYYSLEVKGKDISIDLNKVSSKYKLIFDALKRNLKIIKT